jgi:hypothetical protein
MNKWALDEDEKVSVRLTVLFPLESSLQTKVDELKFTKMDRSESEWVNRSLWDESRCDWWGLCILGDWTISWGCCLTCTRVLVLRASCSGYIKWIIIDIWNMYEDRPREFPKSNKIYVSNLSASVYIFASRPLKTISVRLSISTGLLDKSTSSAKIQSPSPSSISPPPPRQKTQLTRNSPFQLNLIQLLILSPP